MPLILSPSPFSKRFWSHHWTTLRNPIIVISRDISIGAWTYFISGRSIRRGLKLIGREEVRVRVLIRGWGQLLPVTRARWGWRVWWLWPLQRLLARWILLPRRELMWRRLWWWTLLLFAWSEKAISNIFIIISIIFIFFQVRDIHVPNTHTLWVFIILLHWNSSINKIYERLESP